MQRWADEYLTIGLAAHPSAIQRGQTFASLLMLADSLDDGLMDGCAAAQGRLLRNNTDLVARTRGADVEVDERIHHHHRLGYASISGSARPSRVSFFFSLSLFFSFFRFESLDD